MTLNILQHLLKQCDSIELGKGYHGNRPRRQSQSQTKSASDPDLKSSLGLDRASTSVLCTSDHLLVNTLTLRGGLDCGWSIPLLLVPLPQEYLLFDIQFKNCVKVHTPAYGVSTLLPPSGWWLEAGHPSLNIQGSLQ